MFKQLFQLLIKKCNRPLRRALKLSKDLLAVDSTTITVGKTRLPWAAFHGERAGVKLHVQFHVGTLLPRNIEETIALDHDGPIGEKLTDPLCILVEDRAYGKIARFDRFKEDGQSFVIRLKNNVHLAQPYSLKRILKEDSRVTRDFTCKLGTPQKRSKNRFRVVIFMDDNGNEIRVATDLLHVSAEEIAEMYKACWTVETFFRQIKQQFNVTRLFGTTQNAVYGHCVQTKTKRGNSACRSYRLPGTFFTKDPIHRRKGNGKL